MVFALFAKSCVTCTGGTSSDCDACKDGYYDNEGTCDACYESCLTCNGSSSSNCVLCSDD